MKITFDYVSEKGGFSAAKSRVIVTIININYLLSQRPRRKAFIRIVPHDWLDYPQAQTLRWVQVHSYNIGNIIIEQTLSHVGYLLYYSHLKHA